MSGIFGILVGGVTGWLTGTFMGEDGYAKRLLSGYPRSASYNVWTKRGIQNAFLQEPFHLRDRGSTTGKVMAPQRASICSKSKLDDRDQTLGIRRLKFYD